jgi:hypothetical protein
MKKLILLALVYGTTLLSLRAQFSVSVMTGISPESHPANAYLIVNRLTPPEEFLFNVLKVNTQYFGGIKARQDLGVNFFIETGALYTQRKTVYSMKYTMKREVGTFQELEETEDQLIIPLSVGAKWKVLEFSSGLSGIASLAKKSELNQIDGFYDQSSSLKMGWHAGIGINLNKVLVGVEYQSAMNRMGVGTKVHEQPLELMNVPGQCVFKLQYKF